MRLQQDKRVLEEARQRAVEEAEENRQIVNKTLGRVTDDLEAMEKRAVMAESMLEAVENQAAEELRAMEKRAVMAESMLEATLDFHAGAAPRSKRSSDVKVKDNEPKAKETPRFHKHTYSQDSALDRSLNASKFEEAGEFTANNKTSIFGRAFAHRNKVHADVSHSQDVKK